MNRLAVVLAAAAGVATLAVTAAVTTTRSSSLPLPQPVTAQQATAQSRTAGTGTARTTVTSTTTVGGSVTTPTLAPLVRCSVSVSNPSPLKSNTAETVFVTAVPGAEVHVQAHYARTEPRSGQVPPSSGTISFPLASNHVPVGVTVTVTATAQLVGKPINCSPASFTPVA